MRKVIYFLVALGYLSLTAKLSLAQEQYKEPRENRATSGKVLSPDFQVLTWTTNRNEALAAAARFTNSTDLTLRNLRNAKPEFGDKFVAYDQQWALLRPALLTNPQDQNVLSNVAVFGREIEKATLGRTCSLQISASRGEGAAVQYAKAHDADVGRPYRQLSGTTSMTQELEPAEYKFRSFRNGQLTGQTDTIACTAIKGYVKLVIVE